MTKTLTEQWREGTLPDGWYYCYCNDEVKKLYCGDGESLELEDPETFSYYFYHRENGKGQVEVLAPVPSYDEYKELVSKNEQLEKRLEIATKALKDVSLSLWDEMECRSCAKKAIKEMEGVK